MTVGAIAGQKNHYIQNLRGYAATLVVIDHALLRLSTFEALPKGLTFAANDFGAMGVHIFFVISGFIMMFNAYDNFSRARAPERFILARIKRIVPLYYAATLVAIAVSTYQSHTVYQWRDIGLSLAFMPSHVHLAKTEYLYPILGVGWTLNYEMFFYLFFAIALLFNRRFGTLFLTSALLFLVAIGSGLRVFTRHPVGTSIQFDVFYFFTRDIMLYFVFGIFVAVFARKGWFPSVRVRTPGLWGCSLGILDISLCNYFLPGQYPLWRSALAMIVAIVSVTLCVAAIPSKKNWLAEGLGDASYSIYLFHGLLMSAIAFLWQRRVGGFYSVEAIIAVLLSVCGGYLIYFFIENPLNILFHRTYAKRAEKAEPNLVSA